MESPATSPCLFALAVEPMAAMLNFEIADDPVYAGIELQRFDDDVHGSGLAVLLLRRDDRRVDVYRQPGLSLDPANYGIGAGLGLWHEAVIEPGLLEVTGTGTRADVGLRDSTGRLVEVRIDDRDGRRRRTGALLAPVSAAIEQPTSMLLVWMPHFDLLHRTGTDPMIRIDGRVAAIGRLPAGWLHRRHLVKVATDLVVIRVNPARDGLLDEDGLSRDDGLAGAVARTGTHVARLVLEPPIPHPVQLADGAAMAGTWRLAVDDVPSLVSGTWSATRSGQAVDLAMESTAPWRPGQLPLLMRLVTRIVPVFRAWPRTYRWQARVVLGNRPTIVSRWERTSTARAESYERAMGVPSARDVRTER